MNHRYSQEDRVLLARLVKGDRAAGNALYRRYSEGIRRYCQAILHDAADAEDATHNTFLAAVGKVNGLRDGASLRSWVFRIARNECLMTARRRSRHLVLDDEAVGQDSDTPLSITLSGELREAVHRAVQALGPIYREAIILREFEGLNYKEIADATGTPVSTVKFRLFKAREQLAEQLQGFMGDRRE